MNDFKTPEEYWAEFEKLEAMMKKFNRHMPSLYRMLQIITDGIAESITESV